MTPLSKNLAANLAGRLCTGLLTLGLVPVYVRLMGVEAYGLVGLLATFHSLAVVLDLGLSTTLNRELARLTTQPDHRSDARDLLRTLEWPYWAATGLILLASWPLGTLLAGHWIRPDTLSLETVRKSIVLMGLAVGLQFPFALYSGGLLGMQRQVLLNGIIVATAVLRGGGAVLILLFVDRSIESFLKWQVAAGGVQAVVTAGCLWQGLPSTGEAPRFRKGLLREKGRFAGGVVAVTVVSLILTQTDKIVLSRIIGLEQFGYYVLAAVAAGVFSGVAAPLFSAVFPRFSQLVAEGDEGGVRLLYHKSSQTMSVLVLPAMGVMALFSHELMLLWTRNPTTADQTFQIVSLLAVGTAIHGLMHIPYALQLAHGWTRLALGVNTVSIIVLIPLLLLLSRLWGARGAALVWVILNVGHLLFSMQLMHRRLLAGEQWRWYGADVGLPLAASLAVTLTSRAIPWGVESVPAKGGLIAVTGLLSAAAAVLAAGHVRRSLVATARGRSS